MSLTKSDREEIMQTLSRTGGHRETAKRERVIPESYTAHQNRVTREEFMLPSPATGVPVRIIVTIAKDKVDFCPVHVNMHGGGFIYPQDKDDDMYCAAVADGISGVVVDIDYATTIDHPFPTAFEQCYDVVKWVFTQCDIWGANPKHVSIGGSSAGGNLSAAIALRAAATKDFTLCAQVLDYAALDNYMPFLPGGSERSAAFSMLYSNGDKRILQSPYCSPVYATDEMLKNHPTTIIITAQNCPFRECNLTYGQRLAAQGNEVVMRNFLQSTHGFTVRLMGEWQEAQAFIIKSILEACL